MIQIGIDIGGTGIQMGIVDDEGRILARDALVTRTDIPAEEHIGQIARCARDLLESTGYTEADLRAVGAGVPGVVDPRTGNISFCNNLGWYEVPFEPIFKRTLDCPVFVDNDATVAGLAESVIGKSRGATSSVFVTLGTGVGSGIVFGGKPWNGFHGIGGELGHIPLIVDGEPCTCGNAGCMEQYCSATAIIRMGREAAASHPETLMLRLCAGDLDRLTAKDVFDAAKQGDSAATEVFHRFIHYLAYGLIAVIQFLDP